MSDDLFDSPGRLRLLDRDGPELRAPASRRPLLPSKNASAP